MGFEFLRMRILSGWPLHAARLNPELYWEDALTWIRVATPKPSDVGKTDAPVEKNDSRHGEHWTCCCANRLQLWFFLALGFAVCEVQWARQLFVSNPKSFF